MWTTDNIPDLTGKTALVTGANTGIGFETAKALHQAGANVTVASRTIQKANDAVDRIKVESSGKGLLESGILELSELQKIRSFANDFISKHSRLDILVNNAGVMIPPASKTSDGFELQFGVNFIGHFALTGLLFPLLKGTRHSRIVTLSSGAAILTPDIDFENLRLERPYDEWREYAVSKLAGLVFTYEFDRRLKASGIQVLSLAAHPGVTQTDLQRHIPREALQGMFSHFKEVMEPWQGALPTLYAATEPAVKGGQFYGPDGEKEYAGYPALSKHNTPAMHDHEMAKKLWDYAEKATGVSFNLNNKFNSNKQKILVTGGTGFLAVHTILQLLQQGFTVRTTIRSLDRKKEILEALKAGGITDFEKLSIFEADLLTDHGWEEAVLGCEYVLHLASPFVAKEPEDENELIVPARDGALRVLKAARNAGIKRVVLTSSFAAIGYSREIKNHVFTEEDWTDESAPIQAYIKSKTIAEKAAWAFMDRAGGNMELTVINPVGIFGPIIGGISSASLDTVIKGILEGSIKESPPFTFGAVDVRDVAEIHIKAMLHPGAAGQRFLATSKGAMSFYDVAELIKKERPGLAGTIASMQPTPQDNYTVMSNTKATTILDWHPRNKEEAILASVDSFQLTNA